MKKSISIAVLSFALCTASMKASTFKTPETVPNAIVKLDKPEGLNSFCHAILKGKVDVVKNMIALGEDVNQKSLGLTPAIFAARYNKTEILEILIANGADLKVKSDRKHGIKRYAELSKAKEALVVIDKNWKS
ncbi:ankyrin repeat domain-containing protein [Cellulophaga baltica]|uniref:ankyrin repeat domain-containing protein n=1 Tax=Cellulophaga TaxID=104264 RepID=UPI001C06BB70|nr:MULTISPECIES: ankyrin repeat domain-containing protein [Cellulophaga]MBU2995023.1 ankyrin repeat domain-containing protein [Cellulophaga baltica]MDO6766418.1 ankyrin repeat domain-containing protein [Cellulophaga sp. 1_MG-2023]